MLALVGTGYLHANANWFVYCVFFAIQFLLASGFLQYLHVYGVQKAQIYLGGWSVLIIYLIFWVLFFCCLLPLQLSVMSRTKFPPPLPMSFCRSSFGNGMEPLSMSTDRVWLCRCCVGNRQSHLFVSVARCTWCESVGLIEELITSL
jgi:hypothetical protein